MRKMAFLAVAVVLMVGLAAGCGGNGDTDSETENGGTAPAEGQQWAAFAFDQDVSPSAGGSGTVESFTIEETLSEAGQVRKFQIEGVYEGKVTAQIQMTKMETDLSTFQTSESTVSTPVECYQVKHRVTVLRDDTGEEHPDWADITVWIPTGDIETSTQYYWIYPKASYIDSDGNSGEWSYYLTDEMQDEVENPPAGKRVMYAPYTEGDFYGYDEWALLGLYGWGYYWFHPFAEGGPQYLEENDWSFGGFSYSSHAVTRTVGDYTFDAWEVSVGWSGGGEAGGYSAVFSADLPMPIYLKVGQSGGDGAGDYQYEYELTDIVLE